MRKSKKNPPSSVAPPLSPIIPLSCPTRSYIPPVRHFLIQFSSWSFWCTSLLFSITLSSCIPPVSIPPFLHPSCPAAFLSGIPPVSIPLFLSTSLVLLTLYPSCSVSILYCLSPAVPPSIWTAFVRPFFLSCLASCLSHFTPILPHSCPITFLFCLSSVLSSTLLFCLPPFCPASHLFCLHNVLPSSCPACLMYCLSLTLSCFPPVLPHSYPFRKKFEKIYL